MPSNLQKEPFTAAKLDEAQQFECGDRPCQKEVSDWLKRPLGEDGALTSISNRKKPGRVWLYRLDETLVGYGALAKSNWRWQGEEDPGIPVTMVIWYAVHKDFQGQPPGPREDHYSFQIFDDLVAIANKDQIESPLMVLYVHNENNKAIAVYHDYGFTDDGFDLSIRDEGPHHKMYLILNERVLVAMLEEGYKKMGKEPPKS
jgi:hypothetical protein